MVKNNKLISRAQSGDEQAFAELMRAYYAYVYAVVIKIVNNRHDAEEVVQDTFFNAYRGLPQLEDRTKFKGWLAKIARNRARNWRRKQRVDTMSIDEVSESTLQTPDAVADELIRDEQRELIRRAMETLPQKDREIARAYYLDGASYDELIQTHGLSYKAISFRLSRTKQRLIKRLGHLLTAIFLPPATTLKQIYSGGLFAMKIGTAPKITVGAIGIVALIFVGVHQIILPKFFGTRVSLHPFIDTPSEQLAETETNPETQEGVKQPQISAQDMEQIKNFFAQFDVSDDAPLQDQEVESLTEADATKLNPSPVSTEAQELSPEIKLKVEQYAKLAEILPLIRQLDQETDLLCQETFPLGELFRNASSEQERAEINDKLGQLNDQIVAGIKEEGMYYLQIDDLFPNLELTEETPDEFDEDGHISSHGGVEFHEKQLVEYFGKALPWDGNPDYFQADDR